MCGICGFVPSRAFAPGEIRALLERMNGTLVHRGPDDEGYHVTPDAGLAMRRLSIIDVAHGQQPIANEDETLHIVCNGEVYNYRELGRELREAGHRFRTGSDAETILHGYEEWGARVVHRLEGMFAFAIWDARERTLFAARDWFGQKPLYHVAVDDGFFFASEPKALLALPQVRRSLDLVALGHSMSLRSIPGTKTLLEGVRKLPPATRGTWSKGVWREERFWRLQYGPKHTGSENTIVAELNEVLTAAVRSHLVADVSVGAFVSGGIDSSTVTALMAQAQDHPVPTFAIGVKEQGFDERPYAAMVAERYGTDHHGQEVNADLIAMLPDMIHSMDEPVDPFAAGVYLVSGLASQHVKVALGGDGGDEMFAGYDRYTGQRLAEIYGALPAFLRRRVLGPLLRLWPESFGYKSMAQKLRWIDRIAAKKTPEDRYAYSVGYLRFPHEMKQGVFTPNVWAVLADQDSGDIVRGLFGERPDDALIDRMLYADVETRLAEQLLPTVDRMSSAHSLEVRSPFLDRRAAEFAARIPARLKLKRLRLKHMLRRMAEPHLPKKLIKRRKVGFGFPLAHWFRNELQPLLTGVFGDAALVADGILRKDTLLAMVEDHTAGRTNHDYRLWLLLNLELWYRMAIRSESRTDLADFLARHR